MQEFIIFFKNHPWLSLSMIVLLVLIVMIEFLRAKRKSIVLSIAQVVHFINHENAVIIDIRPDVQYKQGHIIDAISLSPTEIKEHSKKIQRFKIKPVILVCQVGLESQKLAASLIKNGYNAYALQGGMRSWMSAEMPLVLE